MKNTRTHNAFLVMLSVGIRQFLNLILQFVSRIIFIRILGAEYLGLNGLFSNVLSLLSLSELGIGSAISFYLYQPLADNDTERIKSLMQFYKNCYRAVGFTMIGIGVCIMPFLHLLVNLEQNVPENLYLVYMLYLLNTACSYFMYAYKQILPAANQEQYKVEKINIIFLCCNCITDVIVLVIFKSYILYLLIKLILVFVSNIVISIMVNRHYPYIKEESVKRMSREEIGSFFRSIKDAAVFRLGSTLYNSTDNILISVMLGTTIVGYYSNYFMIISMFTSLIGLFVRAFTAGIGNLMVEESKDFQYRSFLQIDFMVFTFVSICTVCLFQLFNSFIMLWTGSILQDYILSQTVVAFLCISFYFDGTMQIMNIFREAGGFFRIGRSRQVAGGLCNIILSVFLGKIWGLEGIFASTAVSKGFISVFPFVITISRYVFGKGNYDLLKIYLKHALATVMTIVVVWYTCKKIHMTTVWNFFLEILLTLIISIAAILIFFHSSSEMKALFERMKKIRNQKPQT